MRCWTMLSSRSVTSFARQSRFWNSRWSSFTRTTGTKIRFQRAHTATFQWVDSMRRPVWRNLWKTRCSSPGEATNTEGHHGTVHGAIATGLRAARQINAEGVR